MIRLRAVQAVGKELQQWCRKIFPVLVGLFAASHWKDSATGTGLSGSTAFTIIIALWQIFQSHRNNSDSQQKDVPAQPSCPIPHCEASKPKILLSLIGSIDRLTTAEALPSAVLSTICSYLHPRDVVQLSGLNQAATKQFTANTLWKDLWFRDYGNVLLQWTVGRQVLNKSLKRLAQKIERQQQSSEEPKDENNSGGSLEALLSQHLDQLGSHNATAMRDFYFVFGETYVNYLLAGRNKLNDDDSSNQVNNDDNGGCYLGLHGHILDFASFAPYHPGMIEPVLLECGQDATDYFESLPHSRGAKSIARKLAVIIHKGCCGSNNNKNDCGLLLRTPPQQLQQMLRTSNSRPLRPEDDNTQGSSSTTRTFKSLMKQLLPVQPHSPTRRPPTLSRIRLEWDSAHQQHAKPSIIRRLQGQNIKVYYDPICQEWIEWAASSRLGSGTDSKD